MNIKRILSILLIVVLLPLSSCSLSNGSSSQTDTDVSSETSQTEQSSEYPITLESSYKKLYSDLSDKLNEKYEKYLDVKLKWDSLDSGSIDSSDSKDFFSMLESMCHYIDSIDYLDDLVMEEIGEDRYSMSFDLTSDDGSVLSATFRLSADVSTASEVISITDSSGARSYAIQAEYTETNDEIYFSQVEYNNEEDANIHYSSDPGFALTLGTYGIDSTSLYTYYVESEDTSFPLMYIKAYDCDTSKLSDDIEKFNGQLVGYLYAQYSYQDGALKYVNIPSDIAIDG